VLLISPAAPGGKVILPLIVPVVGVGWGVGYGV